jgi:hypothetical protein
MGIVLMKMFRQRRLLCDNYRIVLSEVADN